MALNAQRCQFIDFPMESFTSPVECGGLCNWRNTRMQSTIIEGKRINIVQLSLVHVMFIGPEIEGLSPACLKVDIERLLDCEDGCDPLLYTMPECWRGPGMMLRPGEYTFFIKEQVAPTMVDVGFEFTVQLIIEPVTQTAVDMALYNHTLGHCG